MYLNDVHVSCDVHVCILYGSSTRRGDGNMYIHLFEYNTIVNWFTVY